MTVSIIERWADESIGLGYERWVVNCNENHPRYSRKWNMKLLSIDPGKSGGLAIYDTQSKNFDVVIPLPHDETGRVDVDTLQGIIIQHQIKRAVIEMQQTRGRQANQGIIKLNYGRITAVLELCGVDYDELTPQVWQAAIHGHTTSDKNETIDYLLERGYHVPMTSNRKDAKPHDGIADAMAIALAYVFDKQRGW